MSPSNKHENLSNILFVFSLGRLNIPSFIIWPLPPFSGHFIKRYYHVKWRAKRYKKRKQRRRFPDEFKDNVVLLVLDNGHAFFMRQGSCHLKEKSRSDDRKQSLALKKVLYGGFYHPIQNLTGQSPVKHGGTFIIALNKSHREPNGEHPECHQTS